MWPWLFLLIINDLEVRDSPTRKFVDDITISEIVSKGSASQIQQDVKEIDSWSSTNKLQLNPDECKELVLDNGKTNLTLY